MRNLNEERISEQKDTIRRAVIRSIRAQERAISEVARTANVSRRHVHQYIANKQDMSGELLDRMIRALRIHVCRTYDGGPVKFESLRELVISQFEKKEWIVADLSRESGVHKTNLSRYLRDEQDLLGRRVSELLTALGFSVHANITPPPVPREWLEPLD